MKKYLLIILLISTSVFSQNYELNTGVSISSNRIYNPGYFIGGNFIIRTNQNRKYLNSLILGFENSGFQSNTKYYNIKNPNSLPNELIENCNCTSTDLNYISEDYNYTTKYRVRGTSINIGVEIASNWYLMSGVTNYKHMTILNGEETSSYRTMIIDVGLKYFIKSKNWWFVPIIRYNSEAINAGIGITYK